MFPQLQLLFIVSYTEESSFRCFILLMIFSACSLKLERMLMYVRQGRYYHVFNHFCYKYIPTGYETTMVIHIFMVTHCFISINWFSTIYSTALFLNHPKQYVALNPKKQRKCFGCHKLYIIFESVYFINFRNVIQIKVDAGFFCSAHAYHAWYFYSFFSVKCYRYILMYYYLLRICTIYISSLCNGQQQPGHAKDEIFHYSNM